MNVKRLCSFNQEATLKIIKKTGVDLDAIDMLILDYMNSFASSKDCASTIKENEIWYHVSAKSIIQGMPTLNIKTEGSINRRISKLIAADLLIRHPELNNFYAFNIDVICFDEIIKK